MKGGINMTNQISLNVRCPICKKSLMDEEHPINGKPSVKLNIKGNGGRGVIRLCSIYGSYDHQCEIDLTNVDIAEFTCPHCNQLLNVKETCDRCGAPMVTLTMDVGGKVNICSRKDCPNHYVSFEDIYDAMKRFYEQFGD